jgi:hypothetical protein
MRLFGDIILSRAKSISNKRKNKKVAIDNANMKDREDKKYAKLRILEVLRDHGRRLGEKYEEVKCHIKAGDIAILNKYEIEYEMMSGWEISPAGFIRYIPGTIEEPLTFRIDKVFVDYSLYDERTERFIDSDDVIGHEIEISNLSDDGIINYYRKRKSLLVDNDYRAYGIYKTAMFTMTQESEFKPKWGLCVSNFIPEGTEGYNQTHRAWSDEIRIDVMRAEYKRRHDTSINVIKSLREAYPQKKYF